MKQKAVFSVLLAGALWGMISLFIRRLSAAGLDTLQIGCVRILAATLMFVGVTLARKKEEMRIRFRDLPVFMGTGIVSIVVFNLLYFYTVIHSQASVAVVLLYTSPVFVMLMSALFFREKITKTGLIALVATVAGCAAVAGPGGDTGEKITAMILLTGIGSGFFYALYTIFARLALARYSSMTTTVWTFLMASVGAAITGNMGGAFRIIAAQPGILLWILGLALISTAMPYFLYTWGLQHMESGKAAILVAVEPMVGTLIGTFLYGESMTLIKGIGIALILSSIVLLNRKKEG